MINLEKKPFYLDREAVEWVKTILENLTIEEKVGQLFCVCCRAGTKEEVDWIYSILKPGTLLLRQMPIKEGVAYNHLINERAEVPLLIAANLECGGDGVATEGTCYGSPMAVAASGSLENAETLGKISGLEGREIGRAHV